MVRSHSGAFFQTKKYRAGAAPFLRSEMGNQIIVVFGSGTVKKGTQQFKMAYETGFLLAKAGFTIANGGYNGSMLASAKGAKAAGGMTIGVTAEEFRDSVKNDFIDREIRKRTWRERLHELIDLGDGFVVLNGGTGTLAELMVSWEMNNKSLHRKPIVVLGHHMKSAINAFRRNPEVAVPKELCFASTPKAAVWYLVKEVGDGSGGARFTS